MRNFILGIVVTLLVLSLVGLAVATLGLVPTNADATPHGSNTVLPRARWTLPWSGTHRELAARFHQPTRI